MLRQICAVLLLATCQAAIAEKVWVFRFLDALGAGKDFEAALTRDDGAWAPGVGASYNWNKGAHFVDVEALSLDAGRVEGVLRATVMPGPWRPGDRQPIPLRLTLRGASFRGPEGAEEAAGAYTADFGGSLRTGRFSAVAREHPPIDQPSLELEMLRAIPYRQDRPLPGADLHLSIALDGDKPNDGAGRTHDYKVVLDFKLSDVSSLRVTDRTVDGEVRFDLPPRDNKPSGDCRYRIDARRVGRYVAGTFRGSVENGSQITGPVAGMLATEGLAPWAASPGDGLLDGSLTFDSFEGPVTGDSVRYGIYLPPGYAQSDRRYAVIYHLHGTGCDETSDTGIVARHLEKAVRGGWIDPVIVVFPNGYENSCWANSKSGHKRAYTNVIEELIPHIDAKFRTFAARECRGVMGMSMGGGGAVMLATRRPDLFAAVTAWDGAIQSWESLTERPIANKASEIFDDDPLYFREFSAFEAARRNADQIRSGLAIRLVAGKLLLSMNQRYHDKLRELDIPLDYLETGCSHSLDAMMKHLRSDSFAWFARVLSTSD